MINFKKKRNLRGSFRAKATHLIYPFQDWKERLKKYSIYFKIKKKKETLGTKKRYVAFFKNNLDTIYLFYYRL